MALGSIFIRIGLKATRNRLDSVDVEAEDLPSRLSRAGRIGAVVRHCSR
jgi:hypothetical protein